MSSIYRAFCLNHDPALVVDVDWGHPSAALDAVAARSIPALAAHADCDLMVARYSAALIELGCPSHSRHPHSPNWIDVGWLRVAVVALDADAAAVTEALRPFGSCWSVERLRRLRPHLLP